VISRCNFNSPSLSSKHLLLTLASRSSYNFDNPSTSVYRALVAASDSSNCNRRVLLSLSADSNLSASWRTSSAASALGPRIRWYFASVRRVSSDSAALEPAADPSSCEVSAAIWAEAVLAVSSGPVTVVIIRTRPWTRDPRHNPHQFHHHL